MLMMMMLLLLCVPKSLHQGLLLETLQKNVNEILVKKASIPIKKMSQKQKSISSSMKDEEDSEYSYSSDYQYDDEEDDGYVDDDSDADGHVVEADKEEKNLKISPISLFNVDPIVCPMCDSRVEAGEGLKLYCHHGFCLDCFGRYVSTELDKWRAGDGQILCPISKTPNDCSKVIDTTAMEEIFDEDINNKLKRYNQELAGYYTCPTPDCSNIVYCTIDLPIIDCFKCGKTSCRMCKASPYHINMSCELALWLWKVKEEGGNLEHVPEHLRKEIAIAKVQQNGRDLKQATSQFQNDIHVVLAAVEKNGEALQYASPDLQNNKTVVLTAVKQNPDAIKYSSVKMKRDPDVLIATGMYDEDHDDAQTRQHQQKMESCNAKKKIVLSTRFSLNATSYWEATNFTKLLKDHEYIRENFVVYAPNANYKSSCDPTFTDFNHPCRGTKGTCEYKNVLTKEGYPTDDCCWRYSFRNQLEEAKRTGGFILQILESETLIFGSGNQQEDTDAEAARILGSGNQQEDTDAILGNGQKIERDMARQLQLKVFHVYRPVNSFGYELWFKDHHVDSVVAAIMSWYDNCCRDVSESVIHPSY